MYQLQQAKQQVLQALKTAVGKGFVPTITDLSKPPEENMGDVAFGCFGLAKSLKKNPAELAVEIASSIGGKGYIASVKAMGPYVNFFFDTKSFAQGVLGQIQEMGSSYGSTNIGEGKRIMVEFANLNSHKDVHIGHLRNLFIGQTTVNVLKIAGYDVIPVAYINDLGAHVAQSVWCYKTFHAKEKVPAQERMEFLSRIYVEANQKLTEHPELKEQVSEIFRALETARGSDVKLWKKTRAWSIAYLKKVYDELSLTIDHWYFESDLIDRTKKVIEELIEKQIVVKSEGAWIVHLEEEKLGVNVLIKSDGTLLYNAKDLALALKKEEDYHPLRSLYVIDERQSHALEQLFATLKKFGFTRELQHLSYDFVTLADGAMAARKGNVVRYETLRDAMKQSAEASTRERHATWSDRKVQKVSTTIAFSAIRFSMLKQDMSKPIVFDKQEALSFEGFTGPYILYTYARIQSILKRAKKMRVKVEGIFGDDVYTHALVSTLAQYPEVIFTSATCTQPSGLAQYVFHLAKQFSAYYEQVHVLQGKPEEINGRLQLLEGVSQVILNSLGLLGIETIKEM